MQQRISWTISVVVLRPVGVNQARTRLAGSTSEETSWAARAIHRAARLALYRRAPFESPHPPKNPCQPSVTNQTPSPS